MTRNPDGPARDVYASRYLFDKYGMTHTVPMWALRFWKRIFCPRGVHCFDQVFVPPDTHYLSCDACGLAVWFYFVEEEQQL